jgi:hypothetical protein
MLRTGSALYTQALAHGRTLSVMKTFFLLCTGLGFCLSGALLAQQGSAGSTPAPAAGAGTTAATNVLDHTGVAMKNGSPWLIRNQQASKIDNTSLPDGQMLNASGQLAPLPAQITGFDAPASETASSTTSASAATADPSATGIALRGGSLFLIRDGKATRIDTAALGDKLMMTLDGRQAPIPDNVSFDSGGSKPANNATQGAKPESGNPSR